MIVSKRVVSRIVRHFRDHAESQDPDDVVVGRIITEDIASGYGIAVAIKN